MTFLSCALHSLGFLCPLWYNVCSSFFCCFSFGHSFLFHRRGMPILHLNSSLTPSAVSLSLTPSPFPTVITNSLYQLKSFSSNNPLPPPPSTPTHTPYIIFVFSFSYTRTLSLSLSLFRSIFSLARSLSLSLFLALSFLSISLIFFLVCEERPALLRGMRLGTVRYTSLRYMDTMSWRSCCCGTMPMLTPAMSRAPHRYT